MAKDTRDYAPHGGKHLMTADGSEGYEKLDDKIWPAPRTANVMDGIIERSVGLDDYIQAMNRYIVEQFRILAAERKRFWEEAAKMYGIDLSKGYRWNTWDRRIEPIPPAPKV